MTARQRRHERRASERRLRRCVAEHHEARSVYLHGRLYCPLCDVYVDDDPEDTDP